MNDPYKVLGISPSATDDEVREAYRKLSMELHPDLHQASPLADIAEEKMKDLNNAFDEVMNLRRGGVSGDTGYGGGGSFSQSQSQSYGGQSYGSSQSAGDEGDNPYMQVRRMIRSGQVTAADSVLERPNLDRNGEWHFLKGSICYGRGWLNEAYGYFSKAVEMEPSNMEYNATLNQMNRARSGQMNGNPNPGPYRQGGAPMMGCSFCDMCQGMICADCCCECMGGDLIPCC